jgi:DDE domain
VDEMAPAARHVTERYANNSIEADHGRFKARLRPMRGLKRWRLRAPPPGMPSCRTCAAATTRSPLTCRSVIESASRSTALPYPSDRSELAGESAADRLRLQQRNSALQVIRRGHHRVRPTPARQKLQVLINQPHPDPHRRTTSQIR